MAKNEFLRSRPAQRNKNILFDLSNLIIPVVVVVVGIIVSTQTFAKYVNYNITYTDVPIFVTRSKIAFIDAGYPFYNPGLVFLNICSKPFDKVINAVLFRSLFPLLVCVAFAVLLFFVVSAIRGYGLTRNDNLYGTARWGNEKDLKKFGLIEKTGVVLAQFQKADIRAKVNPKNSSIQLSCKKNAPLVCHSGATNTLMIAPTRSGKGVGSVVPTALNFPFSMIFFDPKGELFNITAGFRSKFSHILKFAPKNANKDTVCFNPLEEVNLDTRIVSDVDLIIQNLFEESKGGDNSTAQFFDNNTKDMLKTTILHVLTCNKSKYELKKNLQGVFSIMSSAANPDKDEDDDEEESKPGDKLFNEMLNSNHYLNGYETPWLHELITDGAGRMLQMNPKVRSDVFSTTFAKLQLFSDPLIGYATSKSDFKLQDFVDSAKPISLYLVVPFAHVDVIAPVFKLLINFMLRKFSDGETSHGEVKLKNRILFMLDEFPVLGNFPFLVKTMGVLAGYGINFFLICQGLNQLVDIYGQNHPFLDHCKTLCVYAPGKIEDAKAFTEAIGKESVTKESLSTSGSRYAVALNNLNASSSEVARDLMNADELMHLPPSEALILNQGMPAYIAKKVVYYEDKRFKDKAYSVHKVKRNKKIFRIFPIPFIKEKITVQTGFEPPASRKLLERELIYLPSNIIRLKKLKEDRRTITAIDEEQKVSFNVVDFLETYEEIENFASPYQAEIVDDDELPPTTIPLEFDIFSKEEKDGESVNE